MKQFSLKEYLIILAALALATLAVLNYFDVIQIDLLFLDHEKAI